MAGAGTSSSRPRSAGRRSSSWTTATTPRGRRTASASSTSRVEAGSGTSGRSPRKAVSRRGSPMTTSSTISRCWSPDGRWIAYGSGNGGLTNLRVIPAAGGVPVDLTHGTTFVLHPYWSPDGRSIVYSTLDNVTNLWELPFADGRAAAPPRRVTLGPGQDVDAAVSQDGKFVAFATTRTNGDIWELSLPTGALRQVTAETTLEQYPQLSPDGKTLLVESDRKGPAAIWTLDLSGRFLEQVSPDGARTAHWSPDGRQVSYVLGGTIRIHPLGSVSGVDTGLRTANPVSSFSPDGTMLAFSPPGTRRSPCTRSPRARFVDSAPCRTSAGSWGTRHGPRTQAPSWPRSRRR